MRNGMDLSTLDFNKVCRTCGLKADNDSEWTSIFPDARAKQTLSVEMHELFSMLNLNFTDDDVMPQRLCPECVSTFLSIQSFLNRCKKVQEALNLQVVLNDTTETDRKYVIEKKSGCNYYSTLKIEREDAQDIIDDEKLSTKLEYVHEENSVDTFDFDETELNDDDENKDAEAWQCEYFITANGEEHDEEKVLKDEYSRQSPIDHTLKICDEPKKPNPARKKVPKKRNKARKKAVQMSRKLSTEKCPFCKRTVARITQHVPSCPERSVEVCSFCFLAFKSKTELDSHLDKMHSEKLPACHICFCTFEDTLKRNIHMRDFHNQEIFKCTVCDIVFKTVHTLNRHNDRKHSPVVNRECPICKKVLDTQFHYNYHMETHTKEKRYQCKYCGKGFMQPHHKDSHERSHTGEKPYLCDGCGKTYKDINLLKAHLVKHDRLAFPTKSYLNAGTFPCKICDKVLKKRTTYYAHMRNHRQSANPQLKCDKCNKRYTTKYNLAIHPCERLKENGEKIFPYNCAFCRSGFATPTALARHVKKHQEKRQHACSECDASFKRIEHLKGHVKRMHLKLRNYECTDCGRKFVQRYELTAHKRVHSDEKPYKCKDCPAAFKWKNILNIHERTHTGEKPYPCDVCGASFKLMFSLRMHLVTHSEEEIKAMEQQIYIDFENSQRLQNDNENNGTC